MEIPLYQIDAYASNLFEGNPAAVCPLTEWLPEKKMQSIAQENNLSETAFFVPTGRGFGIRWFTPAKEVDLCGHGTLATAYVLFNILGFKGDKIEFDSKSGRLNVTRDKDWLVLDFPAQPPVICEIPHKASKAFGSEPLECLKSRDYILVFENESDIIAANPDLRLLMDLDLRGVIITAKSNKYDFVVRFFVPKYGVSEDPVTGSAYTQLTPYWSHVTGSKKFFAKQLSSRGGEVVCRLVDDRVLIAGQAIKYLEGRIQI